MLRKRLDVLLKPTPLGFLVRVNELAPPSAKMKKVLVILGPTATGKTDLALALAAKFDGELVSCDSRQVYKDLDIGTGKKPSKKSTLWTDESKKLHGRWVIDGVSVWMYDVVSPEVRFTVKDYTEKATWVIKDVIRRGKLPIIVGGTGLYLKALTEGLPNLGVPVDEQLRRKLEVLPLKKLQERLQSLSPLRWIKMNNSDRQNKRRLLRAIELLIMHPYKNTIQNSKSMIQSYETLKIGLTAPRKVLNQRIDLRLILRIDQGLIEEGKKLQRKGLAFERMRELGLEYGMLAELLEGKISKEEFVRKLQIKIHQYAKRQMTWFRKERGVHWFDVSDAGLLPKVEKLVRSWYDAEK